MSVLSVLFKNLKDYTTDHGQLTISDQNFLYIIQNLQNLSVLLDFKFKFFEKIFKISRKKLIELVEVVSSKGIMTKIRIFEHF